MRVVYLGNYRHDFCTEVHLTRELEGLGHTVTRVQEPVGGGKADFLDELRRTVAEADAQVLIWQRTWGLPPAATELWRELEAGGCQTASYHLDLYLGLARQGHIGRDPFWTTGHVFTPDGNPESAEWFADHGINHHWLLPAVVSDECSVVMPGTWRGEFDYDVVFVGSYGYHEEWPWRTELIDGLAQRYGYRFRRFGGDVPWGSEDGPRPVRGQDLNDLYATARVVVGDSCFAHPGQRYMSDRPFETWGRGGYLVFPRIELLRELVGPYPSYEPGDLESVYEAVELALADAYHRDGTRRRLEGAVYLEHTYRHRLGEALLLLEEAGVVAGVVRPAAVPDLEPVNVQDVPPAPEAPSTGGAVDWLFPTGGEAVTESRVVTEALGQPTPLAVVKGPTEDPVFVPVVARFEDLIRLELGSGYRPTEGFVHVDLNQDAPEVDHVAPVFPLPWLEDGACCEIRAVDVLEHVSYRDTGRALDEWTRVAAPGCRLYVQVPDAHAIMARYLRLLEADEGWTVDGEETDPLAGAEWRLLGGHQDGSFVHEGDDWRWNAHYSLWSEVKLRGQLVLRGWAIESLEVNAHPNLCCWAVKR